MARHETFVKYDEYQKAYDALLDGRGTAFFTGNTEEAETTEDLKKQKQQMLNNIGDINGYSYKH